MGISNDSLSCRSAEALWQNVVKAPQEYVSIPAELWQFLLMNFRIYIDNRIVRCYD